MRYNGHTMKKYPRIYDGILKHHLAGYRQMAFVTGPRQVGKTTTCHLKDSHYLSWDILEDRQVILKGPAAVAERSGVLRASASPTILIFDELHKHPFWKDFLKGFFDAYEDKARILVTGSARLDHFRRGGDSLVGRYFQYRMHPFTVGELARPELSAARVAGPPCPVSETDWKALAAHGGFPEPFTRRQAPFTRLWGQSRLERLVREDLRDLTRFHDLRQMEALAILLLGRSATAITAANLARDLQTSTVNVLRWIQALEAVYLGFTLRPWHRSVSHSLRKEPKWYLRDWSGVEDEGARAETLVACHLLKAVETWTDLGLGRFELGYLRDKQKREVDFIVARDGKPWFLAEVKKKDEHLSPSLAYFQKATGAKHAFQVVLDLPWVEVDCFKGSTPVVVPARTFLSQLP